MIKHKALTVTQLDRVNAVSAYKADEISALIQQVQVLQGLKE